jgi:conjugal transfer pilus assembly protein TraF
MRKSALIVAFLLVQTLCLGRAHGAVKGWWWYETQPPVTEEKEKPAESKLQRYTPDQLANMDPDDFQQYAEKAKKDAVRQPTEENVMHYYEVQEVARTKAVAFANASQLIWQKYPNLSVAKDYPIATPGRNALTRQQSEERERFLAQARDEFALLYFRSNSCGFCSEQDGILSFFTERYGWQVKSIEIDEQPGLAGKFNIQTTPTLVLIHRDSPDFIPVTAGVASASEIEEKLYRGIRLLKGEVGTEDFGLYEFQRGGGFDPKRERR